jgi:hypothetical protein
VELDDSGRTFDVDAPAAADSLGAATGAGSMEVGLVVVEGDASVFRVDGSDTKRCIVVTVEGSMPLDCINSTTTALSSFSGLPKSTNCKGQRTCDNLA